MRFIFVLFFVGGCTIKGTLSRQMDNVLPPGWTPHLDGNSVPTNPNPVKSQPWPALNVEPKWPPVKEPTMFQKQPWPPAPPVATQPPKKSCNSGAPCYGGEVEIDFPCGEDGFCQLGGFARFGYYLLHLRYVNLLN